MFAVPSLNYYRRIASAYLLGGRSHLSFWHETPQENSHALTGALGEYYMLFREKADYAGPFDAAQIPVLDYRGSIGQQYNPIAIAQYGLGNYNLFCRTQDRRHRNNVLLVANWLVEHLEQNSHGFAVWNHHFDWEYRNRLRAPWYSALAQGQGVSLLVRAYKESADPKHLDAAHRAIACFFQPINAGGVTFTDERGNLWFEEYIVSPPTHILNGFIWAAWGVYDYFLTTHEKCAQDLFASAVQTLLQNLERYDLGFWSLYEQSGTRLPMVASLFYHQLHIVQLRAMHRLTGEQKFAKVADRWEAYAHSVGKRTWALCYKSAFKLCYY